MEMVKETAMTLVKEPRVRVVIACTLASWPLMFGGLVWLSALPFEMQLVVGTLTGIAIMMAYYYMMVHRTHVRMRQAVKNQQLSNIDAAVLRRLVPDDSLPSWVQSGFDKVEWINKCLIEVWPFLDKAVGDAVRQQVQPILDQYKLGAISELHVKEVTLGTVGPVIGGFKLTEGGKDECMLECELDWRHGKGQKVSITVKTPGPDFDVEVNNFEFYAILRVILKPLIDDIPGFGAVMVSLREPPEVDFKTSILGGDLTSLPGVDNMIDNLILSAMEDTLVWPSRIVVPLGPGDYSYLQLHTVGILHVVVLEAKGIKGKDWFGKSDPFLMLYIRPKEDKIKRTSTKSNTTNAVWNEAFDLEVEDPLYQKLNLRLMDSDSVSAADLVGAAEVPIKQLEALKTYDLWLPLVQDPKKPKEGESKGQVHIFVSYKPTEDTSSSIEEEKARLEASDQTAGGDFATAEKATGKAPTGEEKKEPAGSVPPEDAAAAGTGGEDKQQGQGPEMKEVELPTSPEDHDQKLDTQDIGAQHAAALDLNTQNDARMEKAARDADDLMEQSGL